MKAKRPKVDLKALKKRFPSSAVHLDLFEEIQKAAYSVGFKPPFCPGPDRLTAELRKGRTVLDACLLALDEEAFAAALKKLFNLLTRRSADRFSQARKLPAGLMVAYLRAEEAPLKEFADMLGLAPAELVSCCQQAARPQLAALRDVCAEVDLTNWSQGHCPVCGALPAFARIEPSGVRQLFCPNCYAQYRFRRHHCPGCAGAGLKVLQMEAWPGLLLEVCPKCNTYLKTFNLAVCPPPCPFPYVDIVTRGVDEAAELQNLKRLSISVFGV